MLLVTAKKGLAMWVHGNVEGLLYCVGLLLGLTLTINTATVSINVQNYSASSFTLTLI